MTARGALLLFGLISCTGIAQDLDDSQRARLQGGDILIESVTNEEGVHGLRAAFLIKARPEAVWGLLTDYERYRDIFANVEEVAVLEESPQGARLRLRVRVAWMDFEYTLERLYEQPGRRLTYRRTEGDLRSLSGEWLIRPEPDDQHQLVICKTFVDVGFPVPGAWVRSRAASDLRDTARRMRQQLEPRQVAQ